jgi:hypothetical protein
MLLYINELEMRRGGRKSKTRSGGLKEPMPIRTTSSNFHEHQLALQKGSGASCNQIPKFGMVPAMSEATFTIIMDLSVLITPE